MNDNGPYILFYLVAVVFLVSSFVGRREPLGKTMKLLLAWLAIFAVVFALFAFRSEFTSFGQRLRAEATGNPIAEGKTIRIPISEDGHFWVDAKLNGQAVRFMVDSGATITTVSRRTAQAAGMDMDGFPGVVSTANGSARVTQSSADRFEVASIVRSDFPIDVNEQDDLNLLGMNFLRSLSSWRVEGNYLVLQP